MRMYTACLLPLILLAASLAACANPPRVSLNDDAQDVAIHAGNTAHFTDQTWAANFTSATPTHALVDDEGMQLQTAGPGTSMAVRGLMSLWSPKNVTMRGVKVTTPDGLSFEAAELDTNVSDVVAAHTAQVELLTAATAQMNRDEADRYIKSLEAAGRITADLATLARDVLLPGLPAAP